MPTLINCLMADGRLYSLEINKNTITKKYEQGAFLSLRPEEACSDLSAVEDFAQLARECLVDAKGALILPGMIDIHVHSRDPGMVHKESWESLAASAFKGGVVALCDMPNTIPATMDRKSILLKKALADKSGLDYRFFLGASNKNLPQIAELLNDRDLPLCGLKVYLGQSTGDLMFAALDRLAGALQEVVGDPLIAFHAEDQTTIDRNSAKLLTPDFSEGFGLHSKLRTSEAAFLAVREILQWARKTSYRVHICHVSTAEEMELILQAKEDGVRVTCEVAPHHLWFSTEDYGRLGGGIKINPSVRTPEERDGLIHFFADGKIDIFATDHAPHTLEEKRRKDYEKCPSGVPAIEFFTPLLLTLAKKHKMPLTEVVKMATWNAAFLFDWKDMGELIGGKMASFVWVEELDEPISASMVGAKCGFSPYLGETLLYRVRGTWHGGKRVYTLSA